MPYALAISDFKPNYDVDEQIVESFTFLLSNLLNAVLMSQNHYLTIEVEAQYQAPTLITLSL